ncbi:hypothetical protein NC651_030679 [Populus alba x Populus x berolinensis]|nr:hypothetical protein NC651_030679 [Populus alba x Populus x berolinensis]
MVGQTILVTGGAGFFGTHTVVQLLNEGFKVSIIDNHDNCVTEAVDCVKELVDPQLSKNLEFNLGDLRKKDDLEKLFSRIKFDAVIPFSGLKAVGESVADPRRYFDNNLVGTINLYEVMAKHNWKKDWFTRLEVLVCFLKEISTSSCHFSSAAKSSRKKLELLVLSFSMLGDNLLPFSIQSTAY